MQSFFIQYVFLILIILALVMVANKLRLAYPIVLVLGGLALSFTTKFSNITIDPELVYEMISQRAMLGRPPALDEIAETAAFLASDRAGAITSGIVNATCGLVPG